MMIAGAVLGFFALAASLFSSFVLYRVAGSAQAELETRTLSLGGELERQKRLTVEAEMKLGQLRKLAGPRDVDFAAFVKSLEGKPKSPIVIWYLPDTSDGYWFANRLTGAFIAAKWPVSPPVPIPEIKSNPKDSLPDFVPLAVAAGGQSSGITVVSNPAADDGATMVDTSKWAVMTAISTAVTNAFGAFGGASNSVPPGTLRIVVAAKTDPIFKSSEPVPKK